MVEENEGRVLAIRIGDHRYLPEAWTVSSLSKVPVLCPLIWGDFVFKSFISLCYVPCTVLVAGVTLVKKERI